MSETTEKARARESGARARTGATRHFAGRVGIDTPERQRREGVMASRTQAPQQARAARYVRAEDALPADLLDLIQTHVESVYVWVPSRATERRRLRDAEIFQRRAAGESIHEVAIALGLTARRICQIQQRARRMDRAGEGGAAATREQDALRDERDALRAELERLKAEAAVGIVEGA